MANPLRACTSEMILSNSGPSSVRLIRNTSDCVRKIIAKGVPKPKRYEGVMPPMGGSPLSKQDLAAVSAYVWAIGHAGNH